MKYPKQQFELLVESLQIIGKHFELSSINPSRLHYIVYQQGSEGQKHNSLMIKGNTILKFHSIGDQDGFLPLINFLDEVNFPLYPEGCNDSHIETAVKLAINKI